MIVSQIFLRDKRFDKLNDLCCTHCLDWFSTYNKMMQRYNIIIAQDFSYNRVKTKIILTQSALIAFIFQKYKETDSEDISLLCKDMFKGKL